MAYGWQIANGKDLDMWVRAFNLRPRHPCETDAEVRSRVDDFARHLPHQPKSPQDMTLRELFDHVAIINDAIRAALLTHPGMTPAAPTEYFHIQQFKIWKGLDPDKPMWADLNLVFRDRREAQDTLDYLARNKPEYPFRIEARRAAI